MTTVSKDVQQSVYLGDQFGLTCQHERWLNVITESCLGETAYTIGSVHLNSICEAANMTGHSCFLYQHGTVVKVKVKVRV